MEEQTTQVAEQPVVKSFNGLGLAGFIVSIISFIMLFSSAIMYSDYDSFMLIRKLASFSVFVGAGNALCAISLFIGIFRKKKIGLSIAGLIISAISDIIFISVLF